MTVILPPEMDVAPLVTLNTASIGTRLTIKPIKSAEMAKWLLLKPVMTATQATVTDAPPPVPLNPTQIVTPQSTPINVTSAVTL